MREDEHHEVANACTGALSCATSRRPFATAAIDTETLELLEGWAREDATGDPEKLRNAQKELDEFKKAMNENRAVCGERILYP